jgi:hypothetical protein
MPAQSALPARIAWLRPANWTPTRFQKNSVCRQDIPPRAWQSRRREGLSWRGAPGIQLRDAPEESLDYDCSADFAFRSARALRA